MNLSHKTPLYEQWHNGGFVVSEANGHLSRDQVTLGGGVLNLAGTILGKITSGASAVGVAVATSTNTGNGTIAIGTQPTSITPAGVYTATMTAATVYTLTGPGNFVNAGLPTGTAVEVDGMIFTITVGATPMVAGDSFVITVTAAGTTGNFVPWNPAATDGSQGAAGILWETKDTTSANATATIIARQAEVNGSELIWPGVYTGAQQTTAIAALAALGIIIR